MNDRLLKYIIAFLVSFTIIATFSNNEVKAATNFIEDISTKQKYYTESATVTGFETQLNVRKNPSIDSTIVGYLKKNDYVTVLGYCNGWAQIIFNNNIGYIDKSKITSPKPVDTSAVMYSGYAQGFKSTLNVRFAQMNHTM